MSEFGKLTFESVFSGSDEPLRPSHITPENPSKLQRCKADLEVFLKKTPLMVLEEVAKGTFQQTPSWAAAEIPSTTGVEFEMTLVFRGKTVKARAGSKKAAKQKAALDYLHQIVNDGQRLDFFIPGDSDEDAHSNIDQISERSEDSKRPPIPVSAKDVDKSIPTVKEFPPNVSEKNWIGALQEKCQKLKLESPSYEDVKLESTSEFMVTCTMSSQQTRGIKSKIKVAKNLAAWLMLKSLEEGMESVQCFDMSEHLEEIEIDENAAKIRQEVFETKDKKAGLIEILSDKRRFAGYNMEFKYPSLSTLGVHQILLEIQISRPVSPDPDDLQMGAEHTQTEEIMKAAAEKEREQKKNMPETGPIVFAGHGSSEGEAEQSACKSALLHFYTYDFKK